jgi:RNA polymerase subunit RPABC4/transcription elongation factor Spt4
MMSKDNRRGKGVKNLPQHGRGECPVCHRTGIKLLNEIKVGDKTVKVCKNCKNIAAERLSA